MIRFTAARLAELEKYASLQFSEEETAILLGFQAARAITGNRAAAAAFRRARLRGQAKVRALALQAAADGDAQGRRQLLELAAALSPAQAPDAGPAGECRDCPAVVAHLGPVLDALGLPGDGGPVECARLAAGRLRELIKPEAAPCPTP
ncbi:MAG: hypothetical protein BWZ02_02978 [Lentisphaerae bacterium ADurb.BinA184]|nr:MAG: hypothetical protein BWZ02_02978 [Lentisphaerae bacterium ADurb.BinA184]